MTFLDELYYGNIRPGEKEFVRDSKFDNVLKSFYNCETDLNKSLNGNDSELLTKLLESHCELIDITSLENFKIGFRLGVKMMCSVFIEESDVFKNITDRE